MPSSRGVNMKKKHDIGLIIAIIFAVAVIIYVMASGGVHAEKPDDLRRETDDIHSSYRDTYIVGATGDIRKDEVTTDEEIGTDSWLDSVLTRLDTVATEEAEEDVYTDCEVSYEQMDSNDYIDNSNRDDSGVNSTGIDNVLDVWDMGLKWYGISYEDTTRSLKLITIEGYEWDILSYYVACACWSRATEGLWGYSDMFTAFGQDDPYYGTWMDDTVIADYAYYYLEECYRNPSYIKYVNGMASPSNYIYYSEEYGIYVWN